MEPDVAQVLWDVIRAMDIAERQWVHDNPLTPDGTMGPPKETGKGDA